MKRIASRSRRNKTISENVLNDASAYKVMYARVEIDEIQIGKTIAVLIFIWETYAGRKFGEDAPWLSIFVAERPIAFCFTFITYVLSSKYP